MTVLYFNEVDLSVAKALANTTKQYIAQFEADGAFKKVGKEITLVSPNELNETTIGNRTPAQLAEAISQQIPAHRDKKILLHVYLLAPEAGMLCDGPPPFAQLFFKEMVQRGFSKVSIHAIANPVNFPIRAMKMQIADAENATFQPGHLRAFIWENKEVTPLGIVSTDKYRKEMKHQYYTFTGTGPVGRISAAASFAINFLQSQDFTMGRHPGRRKKHLENGIQAIQRAPESGINEIIAKLRGHRTNEIILNKSSFCIDIVEPLEILLREKLEPISESTVRMSNFLQKSVSLVGAEGGGALVREGRNTPLTQSVTEQEETDRAVHSDFVAGGSMASDQPLQSGADIASVINHTDPDGSMVEDEPAELMDVEFFIRELTAYSAMRENEWWGFHYNILGIMSVIYYITDALTGSDHFNSKSRDVKISASDKLIKLVNNHGELEKDFTDAEKKALSEGRLGKKLAPYGGLDSIRAMYSGPQRVPTPVQALSAAL